MRDGRTKTKQYRDAVLNVRLDRKTCDELDKIVVQCPYTRSEMVRLAVRMLIKDVQENKKLVIPEEEIKL